jgi:glycosyltransferase involved in cell wall biosynthesis
VSQHADDRDADAPCSISLVIPLYRVERYLPELLASLSAQEPGDYDLQVIFVDDGSPDRSGDLAEAWLERSATTGMVIRQENQGVSAARNRGLEAATGTLVSFPDSDDVLDPAYCAAIARFVRDHGDSPTVLVTSILRLDEHTGSIRDTHALRSRFSEGSRIVRLRDDPDMFQLQAATTFFRREDLMTSGVRFRTGLHASEDALFVADLLVRDPDPSFGLVAEAKYLYRKRLTRDSAVDTYRSRPDTYIARFEDGYLPLLREAASRADGAPEWLQSVLIYEYKWLIEAQADPTRYARALDASEREKVLEITRACLEFITAERIIAFSATPLAVEVRLLLLALKGRSLPAWVPVVADRRDAGRGIQRIRFYGIPGDGERPVLEGIPPVESKTRTPDYFGQRALVEHVLWVPLEIGSTVRVSGVERTIERLEGPWAVPTALEEHRRRAVAGTSVVTRSGPRSPGSRLGALRRRVISKTAVIGVLSRMPWSGARFAGAWFAVTTESESDDALVDAVQRAASRSGARFAVVGSTPSHHATVAPGSRAMRIALARAAAVVASDAAAWRTLGGVARRKRAWRAVAIVTAEAMDDPALQVALEDAHVDDVVVVPPADARLLTADGSATALTPLDVEVAEPGQPADALARMVNRRS